ncbi:MAG TPA: class II aldolase/adducin family protein [Mycobacteriales bacterium]|nr:class II aldolase/adducin family protein [Mycobacteriales bacterium]
MTPDDLVVALTEAGRRAGAAGLVVGSGGNLSARKADGDECVVTARDSWLDSLGGADFSVVAIADGSLRRGHGRPSSELGLHLAAYRSRPDARAVIHLHPQTCVLLTALGHPIRLVSTDHTYYVRQVATVPYLPPGSDALADAVAAALGDGSDCVVLSHHGCCVVADSVGLALRRAVNLEEAARLTYRALLLGANDLPEPPGYREQLRRHAVPGVVGLGE